MTLSGLLDVVQDDPALSAALAAARDGAPTEFEVGGPTAVHPVLAAVIADQVHGAGRPLLAVAATTREVEVLSAGLRSFLPAEQVVEFPAWETLPFERLSPRSDTVGRRLAVLRRLRHPNADSTGSGPVRVVVATVRALLQPLVRGLGDLEPVALQVGD